jgi:predicted transposase YbfD/YdcC
VRYRGRTVWAAFGQQREAMPHWTTYSRVLRQVDEGELQAAIARGLGAATGGKHLLLDGKSLRGTIAAGQTQGEHLLALYEPETRRVLAQVRVDEKANEIVAAPQVLAQVKLQGKVITGDALFTQRDLSEHILNQQADYLWIVKDNQPALHQMITRLFQPESLTPGHGSLHTDFRAIRQVSKGHGRLECRTLTVSSLLKGYSDWPGLCQVFRLERSRQSSRAPATAEVVFGLTSLTPEAASPATLLALTRRHWAIENQLHHVRDVSLREDACRLACARAQRCLALLNNLLIALLPRTPFSYLPDAQRFFNAHLSHALALLL